MAKKKLFLIGAGDFGREMESWIGMNPGFFDEWEVKGFLDKNPNALNGFPSDYSVIGSPLEYSFGDNDYVLICITNPETKMLLSQALQGVVRFYTYIDHTAIVSKFVKVGGGSIVAPNCIVSTNVEIKEFVTLNCGTQIGHDCRVGRFSSLMPNVDLGGGVVLGERVFMGTNSTIIPRKTVSDNIVIGAGSIVVRNLSKAGTYFGNPASHLKL